MLSTQVQDFKNDICVNWSHLQGAPCNTGGSYLGRGTFPRGGLLLQLQPAHQWPEVAGQPAGLFSSRKERSVAIRFQMTETTNWQPRWISWQLPISFPFLQLLLKSREERGGQITCWGQGGSTLAEQASFAAAPWTERARFLLQHFHFFPQTGHTH